MYIICSCTGKDRSGANSPRPYTLQPFAKGSVSETPRRMINDVAGGGIQIFSSFPSHRGAEHQRRLYTTAEKHYIYIILLYTRVCSKFDGQWIREVTAECSFGWKRSKNLCAHPPPRTLPHHECIFRSVIFWTFCYARRLLYNKSNVLSTQTMRIT